MKKISKLISILLLSCLLISMFSGCELCTEKKPEEDMSWKARWNALVYEKTKDVCAVRIQYCSVFSSIINEKLLPEDKIQEFIDYVTVDGESFLPTEEGLGITSQFYTVTIINDPTLNTNENGQNVYDEIGSCYKYAVVIHIDSNGNIYVKESDSEDRWYKSTKTVDYSKLTEFYRASTIIELGK